MTKIDPEKREEWEMMLSAPLPWQEDRVSEATIEEEGALFMAALAANTEE